MTRILTFSSFLRPFPSLCVLGSLLSLGMGQTVRIPERVEVSTESISLGDIARIEPPSDQLSGFPLGYAPYPGHYRWLEKTYLVDQLKKGAVDLREIRLQMPERILITRQSQVVGRSVIEGAVREAFEDHRSDVTFDLMRIDVPQDVVLPRGDLQVRVRLPKPVNRLDGLTLKLDFIVDGRLIKSQWARIYASAQARVLVLARPVAFGHRLQASDLYLEERSFNRLGSFYTRTDQVVNLVAKRDLPEGQVLVTSHLKVPQLVARNDLVTIIAQGRSFRVSTQGKARDGGTLGDTIQVENLDSRQLLRVQVIGNKRVRVLLPEEIG